MKCTALLLFWCTLSTLTAQTGAPNSYSDILKNSQTKIEMLFPEGKSKALILSYDDGPFQDRKLVELMNKYDLKGTFHLNSNKLDLPNYLTKAEIKDLFKGHEVSVHSTNHPNLTALSKIDIMYEVIEDRRELERLSGMTVRGMAYPFGNYNASVLDAIQGVGIAYARTVYDTYNFTIPHNFLAWHPSIHQFGKAYFSPNQPEVDKKEIAAFTQLVSNFLKSDTLALMDVWGHSWEMGDSKEKWDAMEQFFKTVAHNPSICYIKQIDLVDYIHAYENLQFGVDKKLVTNVSALDIYIKKAGKTFKVSAGTTTSLLE